jgi:hypothetical protein
MIDNLPKKYIQKSMLFLYPQLRLPSRARYKPIESYTGLNNDIHPAGGALILLYKKYNSKTFFQFEVKQLLSNKYFMDRFENNDYYVYVFNLSHLKSSYDYFLAGKYSKFSEEAKVPILDYYSDGDIMTEYIESYLYPELYYDEYSKILNVEESDLEQVTELCDKPDLKKETLTLQLNSKN